MEEKPTTYRNHVITPERFFAAWRCRISGPWVNSVFGVMPTRGKVIAYAKKKISEAVPLSFQGRVHEWMLKCFGPEISADTQERNYRFLEEALELVQSVGCSREDAHKLVDYVFDRPLGAPQQEVGGVMVTLAAFCTTHGISLEEAGEIELARVWTDIEKIRAKQAAKPYRADKPLPRDSFESAKLTTGEFNEP